MPSQKTTSPYEIGVKAVVIALKSGTPLVSVKIDDKLDEALIAPFFNAIKSFSNEVLGSHQEILFKSGDMFLYAFEKTYEDLELMIFALISDNIPKINLHLEAETTLDTFVNAYGVDFIKQWSGDLEIFKPFEIALQNQIDQYIDNISAIQERDEKQGFLARILRKFKFKAKKK
ncbi:MAG: hypothetical protein ACTSVI_04915 [Promethearchaeota archaeon]